MEEHLYEIKTDSTKGQNELGAYALCMNAPKTFTEEEGGCLIAKGKHFCE